MLLWHIQIGHYELVQYVPEYTIHENLKQCGGIAQTEGHHHKLKMPLPGSKGGLPFIAQFDQIIGPS